MRTVVPLEYYDSGYLALAYSGKQDTPRLGWFTSDGEFVHRAGTGYLKTYANTPSIRHWLDTIMAYLTDNQNDALRARGDIRWRVASRAQSLLLATKDQEAQ